jgi:fumarate hydratase, class II
MGAVTDTSTTDRRWGRETELAVANFPISGRPVDHRVIRALARIKQHAALVNTELGAAGVDGEMAVAIAAAAAEVAAGDHAGQFPVDVYQTGSGTSTNMNVNEVVASLATEALGGRLVHPNDHVNASQSSNDVVPSAIRIAVALALRDDVLPAVETLVAGLDEAAQRLDDVVKAGRTHLMDATPVMLGDEVAAWARMLEATLPALDAAVDALGELPLGGSAVGTGVNVPDGFAESITAALAEDTGLPLRAAAGTPARMSHMGGQGALATASAALRDVAIALTKIANDVRILASGPATGISELLLPSLQAGSSIMPGKVNPVLCESANQVAARVFGNDATVAFAASQGILELNTYLPVIADAALESATLLANICRVFDAKLVRGMQADVVRARAGADRTPSLATALNPLIGYDAAAAIVKESLATGRSLRDVARDRTDLADDVLDAALDPVALARPHTDG